MAYVQNGVESDNLQTTNLVVVVVLLGYVHTGIVFQRFQKRFCPFNRFDALFTRSKGKYLQCRVYKKNRTDLKLLSISQNSY